MADILLDDLDKSTREKLRSMAIESGSAEGALAAAIIEAYLHLLKVADFALPANAPGVRAKRNGVSLA